MPKLSPTLLSPPLVPSFLSPSPFLGLPVSLSLSPSMASFSATASISAPTLLRAQPASGLLAPRSVSFSIRRGFSSSRHASRLCVSCAAKPETVEKVAAIVKKQLALGDDQVVNGESKFSALGADSLDTVEIVMGLEEEFGISVEEESAQSITTVQDAADMIEKLLAK